MTYKRPLLRAAGLFVVLAAAAAGAAPPRSGLGIVQTIRATEHDGTTTVVIAATVRPTFTTWKLDQPARVVVDISGATLGDIELPFDANTFAVGAVSASARRDDGGPRTRVVLTLRRPADYQVDAQDTSIVVRVVPHSKPVPAVVAAVPDGQSAELAQERKRLAEERVRVDAAHRAAEVASNKLAAEKLALDAHRARTETESKRLSADRVRIEQERQAAGRQVSEEARRAAHEATVRLAAEKAALGAQRAQADAERKQLAAERAKTEQARREADTVQAAAQVGAEKLAEEKARLESAVRARSEEARRAIEDVRRIANESRRAAEDAAARLATERASLEAQRAQADAEKKELAAERLKTEAARREAESARLLARETAQKAQNAQKATDEKTRHVVVERNRAEAAQRAADEAAARLVTEKMALEAARGLAQAEKKQLIAEREKTEQARHAAQTALKAARASSQKLAAGQARLESAERVRTEEARRAADIAVRRLATETQALEQQRIRTGEEMKRLLAERGRSEEARRAAEAARLAASATAEMFEQTRVQAEEAQRIARLERERADQALKAAEDTQRRAEQRERSAMGEEAAKAREQIEIARRETDKARTLALAAAAEVERIRLDKAALEKDRHAIERRAETLARSEQDLRKAHKEAEEARGRTEQVARQTDLARRREEERSAALRDAAALVAERQRALDATSQSQESQKRRLEDAERLVGQREGAVKAAAAELAARERAAADTRGRRVALEKAGAQQQERAQAQRAAELAESQRLQAEEAIRTTRAELAKAADARKAEDTRRRNYEQERLAEEKRLKDAIVARTAEEGRRRSAEEQRRREETKLAQAQDQRAKISNERSRLEADCDALVAEIRRLKEVQIATRSAPARPGKPAPSNPVPGPAAGKAAPAIAIQPAGATVRAAAVFPSSGRPPSITLRSPSQVQRIDFVDEPTRSSVIIDFDDAPQFTLEKAVGGKVTLRLLHAQLPRLLERSMDATHYLGPVRIIKSYREPGPGGAVRVDVDLAEEVPNRVRQDGGRLYWDFHKTGPGSALLPRISVVTAHRFAGWRSQTLPLLLGQASPPAGSVQTLAPSGGASAFRPGGVAKKRYTGRRIDIDFKGADIHNILRLLADVGNVNIVTSDDVKGEVTIKMKDVPWDQALDVVLRAKMLGSVREGNLIRVAPLTVLEKELEQEIARQKQLTDVLPTETRLIGVSYAEAKSIQDRAKDLLSVRGKVSVDERTNTLIVSDVTKNLALVEELVRNLDTQTSQVVIEARIVEARSTFIRQIGVQWGGTGFADVDHGNPTGLVFPYNIGLGGGAADSQTPTGGLVPTPRSGTGSANPNFAVNLPVAAGTGSGGAVGLTLGSVAGAFNLNLRLSALESSGQVRILSSPRIMTMDNREASIEQGVAIPISVISAQGVMTVFVDAKLNLTVKPHVTNEGTVMLAINVTRNEPDFVNTGARGDPTILKKEARTEMLVRDGDTAVIGGIYQRNSGLNFAKVPFFADIPILGALFRNRRENDDRTEFLVFITPRIANRARALGQ